MPEPIYVPQNWYWIVGGDDSRYWSGGACEYVDTLPDGAGVTRIASETDLDEVLAAYGIIGPSGRVIYTPPSLYAVVQLSIADGNITGIPLNSRFSAALWGDVGLYYIFFAESQPDTNYLAKAYDDVARVRIAEKAQDYIVVTANDANGDPTDPADISIEIIRVG